MTILAWLCLLFPQTGPSVDSQGWTVVVPSTDSLIIYVDPAGLDSNQGSDPDLPKKTIPAGMAALRDGDPDHLRLKAGAVFPKGFGRWTKSGRSAAEPMVVETYGGKNRAKIRDGANVTPFFFNGGSGAPPRFDHVLISGIDLEPVGRTGGETCRGIEILRPIGDVVFEDVRVAGFATNVVIQGFDGPIPGPVILHRCVVLDAWSTGSEHSQGLYVERTSGLFVQESIFDHNGFNSATANTGADIFRHDVYVQNGPPATFDGNVISGASSHGLQLRGGGSATSNLFVGNPIALLVGGGNDPDPSGILATVRGNVILSGTNIDPQTPRGWGIVLSNIRGGRCSRNVIAHNQGDLPSGISLEGGFASGIHSLALTENVVHDWLAGIQKQGDITGLVESGNSIEQPASTYVDATKGVPAGWRVAIRNQSRASWNPDIMPTKLNRKIMAGYVVK